jgi:hypothetical protein
VNDKKENKGQGDSENAPQVWYHYIGGHYTASSFIAEAREKEVSRRARIGVARRMAWGDRVILLKCADRSRPSALVLGEFEIRRITLSEEIAMEVGAALMEACRAHFQEGGELIARGCGSYVSCGTFYVDAGIDEVLEMAARVSAEKGVKPWVLVGGPLVKVYHPPHLWDPSILFHRTFTLAESDQVFTTGYDPAGKAWIENVKQEGDREAEILAVKKYHKRERRARADLYAQGTFF